VGSWGSFSNPIGGGSAETGLCTGDGWRMGTTQAHEKPHLLIGDMPAAKELVLSKEKPIPYQPPLPPNEALSGVLILIVAGFSS